jgi:hypothetical protein
VIREGIRLMDKQNGTAPRKKVIGMGEFDSGITDLGSNKAHLEGYGR